MIRLISFVLGAIFITAGILKLLAPEAFATAIHAMDFLPNALIDIVAVSVPVFEIISGIALLTNVWRPIGALAVVLLNCCFIAFVGQAWLRGLKFDCSCFGPVNGFFSHPAWIIVRDLLLGAGGAFVYMRSHAMHKPAPQDHKNLETLTESHL